MSWREPAFLAEDLQGTGTGPDCSTPLNLASRYRKSRELSAVHTATVYRVLALCC
jgi:hypothetical protein